MSKIHCQAEGKILAIGSISGALSLVETSSGLRFPQAQEQANMGQLLERMQNIRSNIQRREQFQREDVLSGLEPLAQQELGENKIRGGDSRVKSLLQEQDAEKEEHKWDINFFEAVNHAARKGT